MSVLSEALTVEIAMGIASMAIGLVFLYAVGAKLVELPSFIAGLRRYDVMPVAFAPAAATLLIAAEAAIGIAHIWLLSLEFFIPAGIALVAAFFVTVARSVRNGEQLPCLCFGADKDESVNVVSLVRIAVLLAVEVTLFVYVRDGTLPVTGVVTVVLAALVVLIARWLLALPNVYRGWRVIRS